MEGYQDLFTNTCLNFRGISKTPIFQLFKPANIRAYSNDHDYLKISPENQFMKSAKLTEISLDDRRDIEIYTRGQNTNDRWFEERQRRLVSSNFHRICTATDRTNMAELAESLVKGKTVRQNEAMRHGQTYEKEAIHHYEKANSVKVSSCGLYVSRNLPFLGASPDGIVSDKLLVEVKCPFSAKNKPISPVTVPYLKDENGILCLSRKHPYYYQIQGQLYCSERQSCDLIVYTLSNTLYTRVERDEDFISEMISKLELFNANFFRSAVLKQFFYKD